MSDPAENIPAKLVDLIAAAGLKPLDSATLAKFACFYDLLVRWNARTNLTAIRDEAGILSRHFVESIACAQHLPEGVETLLDLGSGAGFPGIPVALCCPQIGVTLAESQGKKAAFLREAVRTLGLAARVHAGRAETIDSGVLGNGEPDGLFDCVTLRAVDKMVDAVRLAGGLIRPGGWLAVVTARGALRSVEQAAGAEFVWREPIRLPESESRVFHLGRRLGGS